jgi:hypothetical protein
VVGKECCGLPGPWLLKTQSSRSTGSRKIEQEGKSVVRSTGWIVVGREYRASSARLPSRTRWFGFARWFGHAKLAKFSHLALSARIAIVTA